MILNSATIVLAIVCQRFSSGDSYLSYDDAFKSARRFPGRGIDGGLFQPGIRSIEECFQTCLADVGGRCLGVDHDSLREVCFLHGVESECSPHWISDSHLTHYRLAQVCQQDRDFEGPHFEHQGNYIRGESAFETHGVTKLDNPFHLDRGLNRGRDVGFGNLLPPVAAHQPSVNAYLYENKQYESDYGRSKYNRFLAGDSKLNKFSVKDSVRSPSFSHDNSLLVEPISFSSNLDHIIPRAHNDRFKSKLYNQLTGVNLPTTSQAGLPTGFTSVTRGSRLSGGFRFLVGTTERQCLDACLMTSHCLAVDYDTSERACYVHSTASYCSGLFTASNVNHYQRIPCIYGSVNRVSEVRYNYLVSGGRDVCVGCSLDVCLERCLGSSQCEGIDYERSQERCYFHSAASLCSSFTPTSNVIHVSLKSCSGAPGQSLPHLGFDSWFSRIRYMGPTKLPRGWLVYPGYRVAGGVVIAFNVSGDECASLCALHDSCYSFDYNTRDGSCWVETSERLKCATLIPTNDVYHAKKPQACIYTVGTHQPYPYPIAVAI